MKSLIIEIKFVGQDRRNLPKVEFVFRDSINVVEVLYIEVNPDIMSKKGSFMLFSESSITIPLTI